jgi:pimeloyl-ACP methyl ester carboxylesterase
MTDFISWDSQPIDIFAQKYAKGKFIDLNGRSTHYIEKGDGDVIILLHGFFYDSYMWEKNIDILAEQFKVYALDLWGFGFSTREPLDYGYPLYSEQVLLFMDNLGIQRASLVQHGNPGPLGQVRVQRLCHLYDSVLLNDQVVPTTYDQGVTNEPISKINTNNLALPVSYCLGAKISVPGIKWANRI